MVTATILELQLQNFISADHPFLCKTLYLHNIIIYGEVKSGVDMDTIQFSPVNMHFPVTTSVAAKVRGSFAVAKSTLWQQKYAACFFHLQNL